MIINKKIIYFFVVFLFVLSGCKDYVNHEHEYINGKCECGEMLNTFNTVTFVDQGVVIKELEVLDSSTIDEPYIELKEGYNFIGWFNDGNKWNFEENLVNTHLILEAKWEVLEYDIVFNTNGGTNIDTITYKYGDVINIETIPSKNYCVFLGWENLVKTMPAHDLEISAIWHDIREEYILDETGKIIKEYIGLEINIVIPSSYYLDGEIIEIEEIYAHAFEYVDIESVEISEGIKVIHSSAFRGCDNLKNIVIPNSVLEIGSGAIISCFNVETISIPFTGQKADGSGNTYFGHIFGTYRYDRGYSTTIPQTLKTIILTSGQEVYNDSFMGCKFVRKIILPESIKKIGDYSFAECPNLLEINIPDGVEMIGKFAFSNCNLSEVKLPKTLKYLGNGAFSSNSDLNSIFIPSNIEYVGSFIFNGNWYIEIYCEVESKPDGWNQYWNYYSNGMDKEEHIVVWGFK